MTNLIRAAQELKRYHPRIHLMDLSGNSNAPLRCLLLSLLLNVPKIPKSKAGITALITEFYKQSGITGDCGRRQEINFQLWVEGVAK